MMEPQDVLAAYIRALCEPLLDKGFGLRIDHAPGAFDDYVFRVIIPPPMMGVVLGHGGENAEAVRRLARARARAAKWTKRIDVRIVSS